MKFVNRHEEIVRLNRLARSKGASLAVVWGRRRVGKSRLLIEWSHKHKGVYYTADESTASIQRKYFSLVVEQALPGFSEVEYPDWISLFSRLARDAIRAKWRGPLVIDEFPYLVSVSPEFSSILQRFVDIEAKKAKLILILCGSSQQMMQGAVLESSSPLYGRAQEIIKLSPINIGYLGEALKLESPRTIVEFYTIWGGIPRYWELIDQNKKSLLESADRLVLDPMGPLNEEPSRLLLEESAIHLRPILDAIGLGAHRLSEVAARIGQPVTSLMRPIQRLIELDFLQREQPFGADEHNSKRTLYKIKDPFLRFWFTVVASRRSFLSQAASTERIQWLKQNLPRLVSVTWEELCRFSVPFLTKKWNKIRFGQAGRFWEGQGLEWDILAQSKDGKVVLVGEAKWTLKAPSQQYIRKTIEEMKRKSVPSIISNSNCKIMYALFMPEKPKNLPIPSDVKVIDAKEVLHALKS